MPRPATPSRPRPAPARGGRPRRSGGRGGGCRGDRSTKAPRERGEALPPPPGPAAPGTGRAGSPPAPGGPARLRVLGQRDRCQRRERSRTNRPDHRGSPPPGCDDRQRRDAVPRAARRRCSCGTANPSRRRGQYRTPELSASGFIAPAASGSARRGAEGWPHAGCAPSSCDVSAKRQECAGRTEGLPAGTGTPRPASAARPVARRLAREPPPSPAATPSPRRPQETETRASGRQVQPRGPRVPK